MPEQMTLDTILDDKPPVETVVEKPEKVESDNANIRHQEKEELAQGRVRDETGKFVKKEEVKKEEVKVEETKAPEKKEVIPPKQEFSDKERALLAALQDERRKRQELEKRQEVKKPDKPFWEAPEDHFKAVEEQHKSWEQKQTERETVNLLRVSELMARKEHPDFDEKIDHFGRMVQEIPGLYNQWLQNPDPAEFAYKTAKQHKDLQEAGNIDTLRENIRKEERLKVEQELKSKEEKLKKEREDLPPTLSDARGTKQQKTVWSGPTTLDDVLKG
jgi:hypothetical protein